MPNCNIKIEFTCSAEEIVYKLKSTITASGGSFNSSANSGSFIITQGDGNIEGGYVINESVINIAIAKKPFWKSCTEIEETLTGYLNAPLVKVAPPSKSIKRDVMLLVIGALITFATATITNYYNSKNQNAKEEKQRELDFNERLSKDLNKRLFLVGMLRYSKDIGDSAATKVNQAAYIKSKEEWNTIFSIYQSLLILYYGDAIKNEFIEKIYNPEIYLGQRVVNNTEADTAYNDDYDRCKNRNDAFITKLYKCIN